MQLLLSSLADLLKQKCQAHREEIQIKIGPLYPEVLLRGKTGALSLPPSPAPSLLPADSGPLSRSLLLLENMLLERSEHEEEDQKIQKHEGQIKSHKDKHESLSNKFEELNKMKYEKAQESK